MSSRRQSMPATVYSRQRQGVTSSEAARARRQSSLREGSLSKVPSFGLPIIELPQPKDGDVYYKTVRSYPSFPEIRDDTSISIVRAGDLRDTGGASSGLKREKTDYGGRGRSASPLPLPDAMRSSASPPNDPRNTTLDSGLGYRDRG